MIKNASFFYVGNNFTSEYRNKLLKYLGTHYEDFVKVGEFKMIIDFHNLGRSIDENLDGHLFVQNLEASPEKFEEFYNYVLSKDRQFIPVVVFCSDKKDYSVIENVLKKHYGEKAKLTNDILGIGRLFNHKKIKARKL